MSSRWHVHIITGSVDPARGGMERAIKRIALMFLGSSKISNVVIYSRDDLNTKTNRTGLSPKVVLLRPDRSRLMEPLSGLERGSVDPGEKYRLEGLLFKNHVAMAMSEHPDELHIIISFFISTSGFVAQHVANKLQIPHLASVRGTDFSRDFYSPYSSPAVSFVLKNADVIVTTNHDQHEAISQFRNTGAMTLIYNAINDGLPEWRPHSTAPIRLISDTGYSFKKGSHVLLSAVSKLANRGLPVHLELFGRTEERELNYWSSLRSSYLSSAPEIFSFEDQIAGDDIPSRLIESDIYCSASLGEGCSDSISTALSIGIPMVATRTGALPDLAKNASHVHICSAGAEEEFVNTLERAVVGTRPPTIDPNWLQGVRNCLSLESESRSWLKVLEDIRPKYMLQQRA